MKHTGMVISIVLLILLSGCKKETVKVIEEPVENLVVVESSADELAKMTKLEEEISASLEENKSLKAQVAELTTANQGLLLAAEAYTETVTIEAIEKEHEEADSMAYIKRYMVTPEKAPQEIIQLNFEAERTNFSTLWLETQSERRRKISVLDNRGLISKEILEMEMVTIGADLRGIETPLALGYTPENIQVVLVVYEAYYEGPLEWLEDGISIVQYYLVRENSDAPWLIDDSGFGFVDEAYENMLEKYADRNVVAEYQTEALIEIIRQINTYDGLIALFNRYQSQIEGAVGESYSTKLHELYLGDQLAGFWPVVGYLNDEGIDKHGLFLVSELHFIEGFEYIGIACAKAIEENPHNQKINYFAIAVERWIIQLNN